MTITPVLVKLRNFMYRACGRQKRTLLISFGSIQLRTFYAMLSFATISFHDLRFSLGELSDSWSSMVLLHAPIPRKYSSNNNTKGLSTSQHKFHLNQFERNTWGEELRVAYNFTPQPFLFDISPAFTFSFELRLPRQD